MHIQWGLEYKQNMKFFEHNGFSVVAGTNARENDV